MNLIELVPNLTIALITIDLGIYAIANSLLGTQIKRNVVFIERRLEETKEEIIELTESGASTETLEEIQNKITEYQIESDEYEGILKALTLNWAVCIPCISFGLALLTYIFKGELQDYFISIGIIFDLVFVMIVFILFGSYRIYRTLRSVEFATLNIPSPKFSVYFKEEKDTITLQPNTSLDLTTYLENEGYLLGEIISLSIFFPPDFVVEEKVDYSIQKQDPESRFPKYSGVYFDLEYLHVDTNVGLDVKITTPNKSEKYVIPIYVNEKVVTQQKFELNIEISDK